MKVLILGGSGQVGWELQRSLPPMGEVVVVPRTKLDICDHGSVGQVWKEHRPDVVVNAAAYTAVDDAEAQPELADAINHRAVENMAMLARESDTLLVHYSSDYVFDGSGHVAFDEESRTGPINAYGRSKCAGDEAILLSGCRYLIFRTSWVHSSRGKNFVRTILRLAQARESLKVVDDQSGAATSAELIADVTARVLGMTMNNALASGVYHLTASGEATWLDVARRAVSQARQLGFKITLAPDAIEPIASSNYPTPARRPLNSRLDTTKIRQAFNLSLPDWQLGIDQTVNQLVTA